MPDWFSIALGIVGRAAVIAGAVYLAFRPYLALKPPKAWMPEQAGRDTGTSSIGGSGLDGLI